MLVDRKSKGARIVVADETGIIRHMGSRLSYEEANCIAEQAITAGESGIILIDLGKTADISTAALARLILLRGALMKVGRDLRLTGLRGRAEGLYQICRLYNLLPRRTPRLRETEINEGYLTTGEASVAASPVSERGLILISKELQPCQC